MRAKVTHKRGSLFYWCRTPCFRMFVTVARRCTTENRYANKTLTPQLSSKGMAKILDWKEHLRQAASQSSIASYLDPRQLCVHKAMT